MLKKLGIAMLIVASLGMAVTANKSNESKVQKTVKESFFGDSDSEYFVSYYKIRKTAVKGIYYINNYVDLNGKKYSKLYFGFDEKYKKIVITDKNGNIKNILDFRVMN